MTEDYIAEIDNVLSEELPDESSEQADEVEDERKQEIIQILQHAAEELGKSPTIREYNSLDFETSASAISRVFGTWNEAKTEAGLETRQRGTYVEIDETYFEEIDSEAKAYWLGTLFANSSLQDQAKSENYCLSLGRTVKKAYFIREFSNAVESEYPIVEYAKDDGATEPDFVNVQISNPTFVKNLVAAGYPTPDEDPGGFPAIERDYRPLFTRGYLESAGYFSTQGWGITVESMERAETFQEWFEDFGAKRPTISTSGPGAAQVRVANVFDIRSIFESCWPDQLETEPSWRPYPEKIIQYLESEYPYPENVSYLSESDSSHG